jgi:hypothetical protein
MKNKQNTKRILSVTLKRMVDESPDTSWLGEYAQKPNSEFSIDRAHSEDCILNDPRLKEKLERIANAIENDRPICEDHLDTREEICETCTEEWEYTVAMEQVRDLTKCDCGEHGDMERNQYRYFNGNVETYKGETPENIRKYVRQDYERMESLNRGDFCFIGIRTYASVCLSVCKDQSHMLTQEISSGGLWGIESDSDKSYLAEVEQEELSALRQELKSLGFSSRAISTAFKNVERKDS